jgi:hypothetical protein
MTASADARPTGTKIYITRYKDCAADDAGQPGSSSPVQFKTKLAKLLFFNFLPVIPVVTLH